MKNRIRGRRAFGTLHIFVDDKLLDVNKSRTVYNHSTEFGAGYLGSGAAQSALAILLEVTKSASISIKHHQTFKSDFISDPEYLDEDFEFEVDIQKWVKKMEYILSGEK